METDPYLRASFGIVANGARPAPDPFGMPAAPRRAAPQPRGGLPFRAPLPMPAMPQYVAPQQFGVGARRAASPVVERMQTAMGGWRPPMQLPAVGALPQVGTDVTLDLLRQRIRDVESSGRYDARNKTSSASGAYQYIDSTWNNFGGYSQAALAPPEVQDAKFNQDLAQRARRYNNDPYKMIAAHYLPALADNPALWRTRYKFRNGRTVDPVEQYVRKVIRGTPLEANFDAYLRAHQR